MIGANLNPATAGVRYPEITVLYSPRYWTLDAVMDFVSPTVAVVAIALIKENT